MAIATEPRFVLPLESSAPSLRWIDQRIIVIGPQGIGKSGLFSNGDRTLYLDTEGTLGHLAIKRLPCRTWEDNREIYFTLLDAASKGTFPYDTIVIDTVDKWVDWADADVVAWGAEKFKKYAEKNGVEIKSVGDIPEKAGWPRLQKAVTSSLESYDSLPAALVLITHPKTLKIEPPDAAAYNKESIALFPSVAQRILGWSHHNLQIQSRWEGDKLKRMVRTRPERSNEAKSHGNVIPDKWVWETQDLKAEYDKLRGLFT